MSEPISRAAGRQPLPEFIAMLALIFAVIAFSIDSMLPALPQIAAELSPGNVNRAQLVLTAFVGGMGLGLSLVGRSVQALGGQVEIHDREGGGTEFVVRLPIPPVTQKVLA